MKFNSLLEFYDYIIEQKINLVGFSGQQGSGKTTGAKLFSTYYPLKLAGPVYKIALAFYTVLGWEWKKDRKLLQFVGTNLGRDIYGKDIWVNYLQDQIKTLEKYTEQSVRVIVDDIRFKNEVKGLRKMGFKIARVIPRKTYIKRDGIFHRSETALGLRSLIDRGLIFLKRKPRTFDFIIKN